MNRVYGLVCEIFLGIILTACAAENSASPTPTPAFANAPRPIQSPSATIFPPTLTRSQIDSSNPITLTLWLSEEWAPNATPAGRVLQEQLNGWKKNNPTLGVNIVLKKNSGKGGLLDFLATTRDIAPARAPDLITLDFSDLALAADARLIQPLDGWLAPSIENELFPFALRATRVENQWMGATFVADVQHLISTAPPPRTWDEFTRQKNAWLLPLASDDAFLLQYLALGASPKPNLDVNASALVLGFFKRARDLGLLPDAAINLKSSDDGWSAFANGQIAMAQVSATRYLSERAQTRAAQTSAIPTRDGNITTLATGWTFAIVTDDPARRAASARLIEWLMQKERLAQWLRAAQRIPATRSALPLAVDPPEYAAFLQTVMERATVAALSPQQSESVRAAISAVWKGQATPEQAARNLIAAK